MIIVSIIISFILEGVFTNLVGINSFLLPLFTVTSLTILYPYFNNNHNKFIGVCALVGFFYDIIYTESVFINTFSFTIMSMFIIIIYNYINMNIFNINGLNVIIIIIFKIVSYMLLCIVGYCHFKSNVLIRGIYHSLIINIIYGIIFYIITDIIGKRLGIRKIE